MADSLAAFGDRLSRIADPDAQRRVVTAAGLAGKKASLNAAEASLGSDRAMSNFRKGRVKLGVGFDVISDHEVQLNYRPDGAWVLAEKGRHRSGKRVRPKRRQARAFPIPAAQGFRASFLSGPSRGLSTFSHAVSGSVRDAGPAASKAVDAEIRKALG